MFRSLQPDLWQREQIGAPATRAGAGVLLFPQVSMQLFCRLNHDRPQVWAGFGAERVVIGPGAKELAPLNFLNHPFNR
jgi:hypothetical protein